MFRYAQIDETGRCVSVSYLHSEVESENMLSLTEEDDVEPGDIWDGEKWIRPEPPEPGIDPVTELQLAIAELAEAHEQDKTDMQLALAELAELIAGGE